MVKELSSNNRIRLLSFDEAKQLSIIGQWLHLPLLVVVVFEYREVQKEGMGESWCRAGTIVFQLEPGSSGYVALEFKGLYQEVDIPGVNVVDELFIYSRDRLQMKEVIDNLLTAEVLQSHCASFCTERFSLNFQFWFTDDAVAQEPYCRFLNQEPIFPGMIRLGSHGQIERYYKFKEAEQSF